MGSNSRDNFYGSNGTPLCTQKDKNVDKKQLEYINKYRSLIGIVALAHGPCTFSRGPCTGPCTWKNAPFQPSKR